MSPLPSGVQVIQCDLTWHVSFLAVRLRAGLQLLQVALLCLTMTQSSVDGRVVAEEWPGDPTGAPSSSISSRLLRLVIRDARKDDEGAYRCNAENEEGVAVTTGYLSVTGNPPADVQMLC